MDYTPVTPFRRPIDAAILKHQATTQQDLPPSGTDKWEVLRELATARTAFGLSDRDLTVLQALVSFHHGTILGGNDGDLIVYPSNKSICERLNGMPCSTMRRHLANLVKAGFLVRRDSPNGKRYARRYSAEKIAFGFDLSPLVRRFDEISQAARATRAADEHHKRLRTAVSLMRRDLAGLADYGRTVAPGQGVWDQLSDLAALAARDLRRKLDVSELRRIEGSLKTALDQAQSLLDPIIETADLSTKGAISEQHHQNTEKEYIILEPELEKARHDDEALQTATGQKGRGQRQPTDSSPVAQDNTPGPNIPLGLVLEACMEARPYIERPVRSWHDLVRVAEVLIPMMGISPSAWNDAKHHMGAEQAAVVVLAMLERFGSLRCPGGYLRSLSAKAAKGEFSCGPMIMALLRKDAA